MHFDADGCTTVQQRVDYLVRLMKDGMYVKRKTARELAPIWNVEPGTVVYYATQASRILRFDPEKREEYRTTLHEIAQGVMLRAISEESNVTGLPDWQAALKSIELAAKFAGIELNAPQGGTVARPAVQITIVDADAVVSPPADGGAEGSKPE
jgi:hypothetical protein